MSRMVSIQSHGFRMKKEERPYRKCPNCNEFAFRKLKVESLEYDGLWDRIRLFGGEWKVDSEWEACKNCQFRQD